MKLDFVCAMHISCTLQIPEMTIHTILTNVKKIETKAHKLYLKG
jgi:hypothetical protein